MIDKLKKVQEYLNGPEAERFLDYYCAEHFNGCITLTEDGETGTLYFDKGHVTKVEPGEAPDGIEVIGVGGPSRIWDHLGDYYQRSVQTVNANFHNDPQWMHYGSALLNRQFNATLAHVCRIYSYVREGKALWYDYPQRNPDLPIPDDLTFVRGFYIKVNGIKVYVETNDGPVDKGVIIALHTAGRDNRQYHDIMALLKDKYRVYAPDQPGHGKSMPLPGNRVTDNYIDYGKWIWDITCALGVKRPIYIGCSMAGGIVYWMAISHPEATRAVVCMQGNDNTCVSDGGNLIELLTHPANNVSATQRDFSDSMIGRKTAQSRVDFIRWGVACENSTVKKGDFMETYNFDVSDRTHEIKCPVRIIEGTDDTVYTVEMAKKTMERLTGCKDKKLEIIEGYGHFIAVENPEAVSGIIDEFIQGLED